MSKKPSLTSKVALTAEERTAVYLFFRKKPTKDRPERSRRSIAQSVLFIQNRNFELDQVMDDKGRLVPGAFNAVIGRRTKDGFFREINKEEERLYDFSADLASYVLDLMEKEEMDAEATETISSIEEKCLLIRENRYEIPAEVPDGNRDEDFEAKPFETNQAKVAKMGAEKPAPAS